MSSAPNTRDQRGRGSSTLVSVVMPSFNSGRYIRRAIESVLTQQWESIELVIQDGCSRDQTSKLVDAFRDERISFRSEPDRGQSQALNRAIRRARGDWILWLNADDELAPGGLASLANAANSADLVYGDFAMVDSYSHVTKRYETPDFSFKRVLRRGAYIFCGSMLVRRDVFDRFGGFDEDLHYCMDFEFLCRIARGVRATYSPGIVAYLRYHPESKSATKIWSFWREQRRVLRRYDPNTVAIAGRQAEMAAYILSRPLRRSRLWRRLRPQKRLG